MNTVAYVYKWTHIPTLKWYVGRRTKKGCYPGDGYICSSKRVKPMVQNSPQDWQQTIIATGSAEDMIELEADILETFDAMNDPRSFNLTNGDGKFNHSLYPGPMTGRRHTAESRAKQSASLKGRTISADARAKVSAALKGKPKSPEHVEKMRQNQLGKKATVEARAKMSATRKGHNNNTPESIAKCRATKLARGSHIHSEATKAKIKARALERSAVKKKI